MTSARSGPGPGPGRPGLGHAGHDRNETGMGPLVTLLGVLACALLCSYVCLTREFISRDTTKHPQVQTLPPVWYPTANGTQQSEPLAKRVVMFVLDGFTFTQTFQPENTFFYDVVDRLGVWGVVHVPKPTESASTRPIIYSGEWLGAFSESKDTDSIFNYVPNAFSFYCVNVGLWNLVTAPFRYPAAVAIMSLDDNANSVAPGDNYNAAAAAASSDAADGRFHASTLSDTLRSLRECYSHDSSDAGSLSVLLPDVVTAQQQPDSQQPSKPVALDVPSTCVRQNHRAAHRFLFLRNDPTFDSDKYTLNQFQNELPKLADRLRNADGVLFNIDLQTLDHLDEAPELLNDLVTKLFPDGRTAFLVTGDHGTVHGAHGIPDVPVPNIPYFLWGAGVRRPNHPPGWRPSELSDINKFNRAQNKVYNFGGLDEYSTEVLPNDGTAGLRVDMNQRDVAALISSLLGVSVPSRSRGRLHSAVFVGSEESCAAGDGDSTTGSIAGQADATPATSRCEVSQQVAQAELTVARQKLLMFASEQRYTLGERSWRRNFAPLGILELQRANAELRRHERARDWAAVSRLARQLDATAESGIRYFTAYDDSFVQAAVWSIAASLIVLSAIVASSSPNAEVSGSLRTLPHSDANSSSSCTGDHPSPLDPSSSCSQQQQSPQSSSSLSVAIRVERSRAGSDSDPHRRSVAVASGARDVENTPDRDKVGMSAAGDVHCAIESHQSQLPQRTISSGLCWFGAACGCCALAFVYCVSQSFDANLTALAIVAILSCMLALFKLSFVWRRALDCLVQHSSELIELVVLVVVCIVSLILAFSRHNRWIALTAFGPMLWPHVRALYGEHQQALRRQARAVWAWVGVGAALVLCGFALNVPDNPREAFSQDLHSLTMIVASALATVLACVFVLRFWLGLKGIARSAFIAQIVLFLGATWWRLIEGASHDHSDLLTVRDWAIFPVCCGLWCSLLLAFVQRTALSRVSALGLCAQSFYICISRGNEPIFLLAVCVCALSHIHTHFITTPRAAKVHECPRARARWIVTSLSLGVLALLGVNSLRTFDHPMIRQPGTMSLFSGIHKLPEDQKRVAMLTRVVTYLVAPTAVALLFMFLPVLFSHVAVTGHDASTSESSSSSFASSSGSTLASVDWQERKKDSVSPASSVTASANSSEADYSGEIAHDAHSHFAIHWRARPCGQYFRLSLKLALWSVLIFAPLMAYFTLHMETPFSEEGADWLDQGRSVVHIAIFAVAPAALAFVIFPALRLFFIDIPWRQPPVHSASPEALAGTQCASVPGGEDASDSGSHRDIAK